MGFRSEWRPILSTTHFLSRRKSGATVHGLGEKGLKATQQKNPADTFLAGIFWPQTLPSISVQKCALLFRGKNGFRSTWHTFRMDGRLHEILPR